MRRLLSLSLFTLLLLPAAAQAATRYTSPTGSGSACSQVSPCSLSQGVTGALDGDTVRLASGTYTLNAQLDVSHSISIEGAGQSTWTDTPTQVIFTEASGGGVSDSDSKLRLFDPNISISKVNISGRADGSAALVGAGSNNSGASFDRVRITNTGAANALVIQDGSLTNSYVEQTGGGLGSAVEMTGQMYGVLAYSVNGLAIGLRESYHPSSCSLSIRNSMAWGGSKNLTVDDTFVGSCPGLSLNYDYSWIPTSGSGGGINYVGTSVPVAGGHNLPNSPQIFNPGTFGGAIFLSTLVMWSGSPVVNAGTAGSDHDFYGRPRPIGSASDIGPREQTLAAALSAPVASGVTQTGATLTASLNPQGDTATYKIEIRKEGAADWTTLSESSISSPLYSESPVSASASGLEPGTRYEARVTASNQGGDSISSPATFTTASASPAPTLTVSSLKGKISKKSAVITSRVTVTGAGAVTQVATAGKKSWCKAKKSFSAAGSATLQCKLGSKGRKALKKRSLKLQVKTTFTPTGGAAQAKTGKVTLKKKR